MKNFRDLLVWQKSHALVLKLYQATRTFPREEQYGVVSQLRRAAVSIPNTAEGCGRSSPVEFSRYLEIAFSSACEVEYLLLLSKDLTYLSVEQYEDFVADVSEVKRMLHGLMKKLNADS